MLGVWNFSKHLHPVLFISPPSLSPPFLSPLPLLPSLPPPPLLPSLGVVSLSRLFGPKSGCQFKSICCNIQSNAKYRTKYLYANIVTENQQQLIYHATFVNFVQEMNNRWRLHKTSINNSNHIFQRWKDTFQYIATKANWWMLIDYRLIYTTIWTPIQRYRSITCLYIRYEHQLVNYKVVNMIWTPKDRYGSFTVQNKRDGNLKSSVTNICICKKGKSMQVSWRRLCLFLVVPKLNFCVCISVHWPISAADDCIG